MRIEIVGPLGVGKTRLAQAFGEIPGCVAVYEDLSTNPFVSEFYKEPLKYRFLTQMFFALEKFKNLMDIQDGDNDSTVYVLDQATVNNNAYTNFQYSRDVKYGREWLLVKSVFEQTEEQFGRPELLINLTCDPYVQLDRIKGRGRPMEANVDVGFIAGIQEQLDVLMERERLRGTNIVNIDVTDVPLSDYPKIAGDIYRGFMFGNVYGREFNAES